jgi:hypothetical protein
MTGIRLFWRDGRVPELDSKPLTSSELLLRYIPVKEFAVL